MKVALDVVDRRRKEPLYAQLAEAISGAIREGYYGPGERIPSEREFMRLGGFSYPTVARAFGDIAKEGLVTRKVGCGTFVSDPLPRRDATQHIGIFYYEQNAFFLPIFAGIQAECSAHKALTVPVFERQREGGEDRILLELEESGVAGILAIPSIAEKQHRELIRLIARHVPVVLMDNYLPEIPCDTVTIDNEGAAEAIAHHLLGLGHRRITFITVRVPYPYGTSVRDRNAGVRHALRRVELAYGREWLVEYDARVAAPSKLNTTPSKLDEDMARVVEGLLARPRYRRPTAIACVSDAVALSVIRGLQRRGVGVPQEISVTGFDDLSWAADVDPPLTTVAQPLERIGRKAAQLLFQRLEYPDRVPRRVELDFRLVVRASTGPAPAEPRSG